MPNSPNITPKCLHIANEARSFSILAMHIQRLGLVHLSLINSPLFFLTCFCFPAESKPSNIQRLIRWFAKHTQKKQQNKTTATSLQPTRPTQNSNISNQPTTRKIPKSAKMVDHFPENNQFPTWIVPLEVIGSMVRTEQWVISPKYTPITKIYSLQISRGEKNPLILTSNGTSKFPLHFPPGVFAGLWTGGTRTLLQLTGSNIRCASAPPKATSDGSKSCVSRCATLRPMTENTWS